jgi:hypothetical protein
MKTYFEPIIEILKWKQEDIITTSPGNADFDDYFDDENWG